MKFKKIILSVFFGLIIIGLAACGETISSQTNSEPSVTVANSTQPTNTTPIQSTIPVQTSTTSESSSIASESTNSSTEEIDEVAPSAPEGEEPRVGYNHVYTQLNSEKYNSSATGYVTGKISDFTQYENTSAYRQVTTPEELLTALADAKYEYTSTMENGVLVQDLTKAGTVHVIEIMNDMNLGYFKLQEAGCSLSLVEQYGIRKINQYNKTETTLPMSDMYNENGISQIKIQNTSNLMIFSKNGAKLTHCGIQVMGCTNVVFRNLEFDEMWQWEDTLVESPSFKVGDYDALDWTYFKISFSEYVWIDHCTFGKSYDGMIDISDPYYFTEAQLKLNRTPYGATGDCKIHISYCNFKAGDISEGSYIYEMMKSIDDAYTAGTSSYLYYNALRDTYKCTFNEILEGLAMPQKKGFLIGDNNSDENKNNESLCVSFANNAFYNFADRIPKLRGGNAYLYNNYIDSTEYYNARATLVSRGCKNIASVNSKFKCALVSQGIVCGVGGSVQLQNNIIYGIDTLFKNNDGGTAGVNVINCKYKKNDSSVEILGGNDEFKSYMNTTITSANFKWNNETNTQPFTPVTMKISVLRKNLTTIFSDYKVGINKNLQDMLLVTDYTNLMI